VFGLVVNDITEGGLSHI